MLQENDQQEDFYDETLIAILEKIINQVEQTKELKNYIQTNKPSFNLIDSQFSKASANCKKETLEKNLTAIFQAIVKDGVQRVFIRVLLSYLEKNKDSMNLKVMKDQGIAQIWSKLTPQELDLISQYEQLISKKKYDDAIQFYQAVNLDKQQFSKLMDAMANNNDAGRAADYIKRFQYDPNQYPKILERLQKGCVRYIYKEYPWYKCEEMLIPYPTMLALLSEDAYYKGQKLEALSIIKRNNLLHLIKKDDIKLPIANDLQQGFEEQENIIFTQDEFKPFEQIINKDSSYLNCIDFGYQRQNIHFISTIDENYNEALINLKKSNQIGIDSEHVTAMTKLDEHGLQVYLIQLATEKEVYLFDFETLQKEQQFKNDIKEILENNDILKIGLSLKDDIKNIVNQISLKPIIVRSILELSACFKQLEGDQKTRSLAFLSEYYFKKQLSKFDTCSNWAKRPLREAQIHYAALDAITSLHIYIAMRKQNAEIVDQEKDVLLWNE